MAFIQVYLADGRQNWPRIGNVPPKKAFSGNGNKYKDQARIAEQEWLLGKAHAEIELLKYLTMSR